MRPRLTFALILAVLLAPLTATPALAGGQDETTCPVFTPDVKITIKEHDVVYDRSKSVKELSRKVKSNRRPDLKAFTHTVGVTEPKITVKSDIPMQVRRNGKRWCAKPTGGIITIELTQTVYIASEAAKGSCVGKVTLTHEKKHVNLNSAFLKLAPRPIITSLHKNPMTLASSGSAAAASRGAAAALKSVVKKALKAEVEKLKQKQDTVDTPQEYARSRQVCGNKEVDALLK